jgi:hypothetical protein
MIANTYGLDAVTQYRKEKSREYVKALVEAENKRVWKEGFEMRSKARMDKIRARKRVPMSLVA